MSTPVDKLHSTPEATKREISPLGEFRELERSDHVLEELIHESIRFHWGHLQEECQPPDMAKGINLRCQQSA